MKSHNRYSLLLEELSYLSPLETSRAFRCELVSLGETETCGHPACRIAALAASVVESPYAS